MVVMVSSKVSSRDPEREGFRRPSDREDIDYRGRGQLGLVMQTRAVREAEQHTLSYARSVPRLREEIRGRVHRTSWRQDVVRGRGPGRPGPPYAWRFLHQRNLGPAASGFRCETPSL